MGFLDVFFETFKKMQSPEIYQIANSKLIISLVSILFGVVVLALCIATAALSKKQRIIGIVAGVANFAFALLVPKYLNLWHNMPMGRFTFNTTEAAVAFLKEMLVQTVMFMAITAIMTVAFAITIVYIITAFKNKPAIFAIGALVINIVRFLMITPYQLYYPMFSKMFADLNGTMVPANNLFIGQVFQLLVFFGTLTLALLLVLVPVILNKIKESKAPAAVEAPATEAEAPAAEDAAE